jgi:MFS family permease
MNLLMLNRVILLLISGDFLLMTFLAFTVPIYSIFIVEEIPGGTVAIVGYSLAVYWIVKSVLQIPIARWLDRHDGEYDDFWTMIFGSVLGALAAIGFYLFARELWHVYALEVLFGIADAMVVPPFYAIFSRHIDRGHEGFEWSLRSSISYDAASALGAAVGGIVGGAFGLRAVFLFAGLGMLLGAALLVGLRPYIEPRTLTRRTRYAVKSYRRA